MSGRLPIGMAATAGIVLGWMPGAARACSVCFSANDENRLAFLVTTIFLTALPLAMIGSTVLWLWRRALRLEEDAAETLAEPVRPL